MKVVLLVEGLEPVDYGWPGDGRIPVEGEELVVDGSDEQLPAGVYQVDCVSWVVDLRGPQRVCLTLSTPAEPPADGTTKRSA